MKSTNEVEECYILLVLAVNRTEVHVYSIVRDYGIDNNYMYHRQDNYWQMYDSYKLVTIKSILPGKEVT